MNPWTMMALMGGLGMAKNVLIDQPNYRSQMELAAKTQALSPWTKMQAQIPTRPNIFGDALQYGTTGLMLGQGMQNMDAQNDLMKAYQRSLSQAAPAATATAPMSTGGAYKTPWSVMQARNKLL